MCKTHEHEPGPVFLASPEIMVLGCKTCRSLFWMTMLDYSRTKSGKQDIANARIPHPWKYDGRCNGVTHLGRRCRLDALPGEAFCKTHEGQAAGWDDIRIVIED